MVLLVLLVLLSLVVVVVVVVVVVAVLLQEPEVWSELRVHGARNSVQFPGARKHRGKTQALLERSLFLTEPLSLGMGASKVLPCPKICFERELAKSYREPD